jgi:hypothetical protein
MLTVRPVNLVLQTAAPVQRLVHIDVMTAWKDSGQIESAFALVLAVLALHFAKSAIVPLAAIVLPASQGMCSIL